MRVLVVPHPSKNLALPFILPILTDMYWYHLVALSAAS